MNQFSQQDEVDKYWPKNHALEYYKKMLAVLLARVERVKAKIEQLENIK